MTNEKVVPVEPTPEMMDAYDRALMQGKAIRGRRFIWDAMLAAAPPQPEAEPLSSWPKAQSSNIPDFDSIASSPEAEPVASSFDLGRELGLSDQDARRFHAGLERAAGGSPVNDAHPPTAPKVEGMELYRLPVDIGALIPAGTYVRYDQAAARIAELIAERRNTNTLAEDEAVAWKLRYEAERAARVADQRDAERYRWLRDSSLGQWEHPIAVSQKKTVDHMQYVGPLIGKGLDAAIDAAITTPGARPINEVMDETNRIGQASAEFYKQK